MPLNLMYITNNPEIARIAQNAGVDRIFIDMEYISKELRQGGLDSVKNHHTYEDIRTIRKAVTESELLVRINPIHEKNEMYDGTEAEVSEAISSGADIIMLPMAKNPEELKRFVAAVKGRAKTMFLLETKEAAEDIDNMLEVEGIDEIHIGLNDLHLSYGKDFMFELLTDGTVVELCEKIRNKNIKFGFGGIARVGYGTLPAEYIITEHYALGSQMAILSRGFCDANKVEDPKTVEEIFIKGVADIRRKESEVSEYSELQFTNNHKIVEKKVNEIVETIKEKKIAVNEKVWLATPTMHGEEQVFVKEAFDKNWVAPLGFNVDCFENEMCEYLECGYALALNAGTAALHLALKLAEVQPGDIVLCSDMTFAATVNPVSYEKAIQVFIESERDTWNMDPKALKVALEKYKGKVKAVMCANLYGTPAKLDEIAALCEEYGVVLIEDAAESLSATYKGRQTGTFGKYNAISFNGNKIITTSGGGMLLSEDKAAIEKARFWSTQARDPAPWYQHSEIGYNYRMSNIVAGIGRGQLLHLEEHKALKKKIYDTYKEGFKDIPVEMNPYTEDCDPNFWLSCLTINEEAYGKVTPEIIFNALRDKNIESRPIWKPMHMQPVFEDRDFIGVGDNVGEDIFKRGLCLPSDIKMTAQQQQTVIEIIKGCFENV